MNVTNAFEHGFLWVLMLGYGVGAIVILAQLFLGKIREGSGWEVAIVVPVCFIVSLGSASIMHFHIGWWI